jgi:microcin C transport system permease protein
VNIGLYILRRMMALIPTLIGISLISFLLINAAPGGPVEQALQKIKFSGAAGDGAGVSGGGARANLDSAVTDEVIESLKRQYGFDKPLMTRYWIWLKRMVTFNFGDSFIYHQSVLSLIIEKFPVSLMLGLVSFLLTYLVCIPLGIIKAVRNNTRFDYLSSGMIFFTYAIPSFMLGILMIVYLGPSGLDWFPIQGLKSEMYDSLGFFEKVQDRVSHAFMPLVCYCIGSFATLTMVMKNSMLEEIKKDYVRTARAKGLAEKVVVFKHVLRNALLPIATGIGGFLSIFFAGSLLLETIFNLDGIGLLGFNSVLSRDFNVIMGLLMVQSFSFLFGNLVSDVLYVLVDPRIDFGANVG